MFIRVLVSLLSSYAWAYMNIFVGTRLGLEGQNFDITASNFPSTLTSTLTFIQDATYDNNSTYTPTSKTSSNAARTTGQLGIDWQPYKTVTLRTSAFMYLGHQSLIDKQYLIYNPALITVDNSTFMYTSPDGSSYYPMPGIMPQSQELICWTQKPYYGMYIAALYNVSNRFSVGPSYSNANITIQSTETLQYIAPNSLTTTAASVNSQPTYSATLKYNQTMIGMLSTYRLYPSTNINFSFETTKNHDFAQKAIYFNTVNTERNLPTSTEVSTALTTSSNWNGLTDNNGTYTCTYGSDCLLSQSANYTTSPYININRVITRYSLGFDFYVNETKWANNQ